MMANEDRNCTVTHMDMMDFEMQLFPEQLRLTFTRAGALYSAAQLSYTAITTPLRNHYMQADNIRGEKIDTGKEYSEAPGLRLDEAPDQVDELAACLSWYVATGVLTGEQGRTLIDLHIAGVIAIEALKHPVGVTGFTSHQPIEDAIEAHEALDAYWTKGMHDEECTPIYTELGGVMTTPAAGMLALILRAADTL